MSRDLFSLEGSTVGIVGGGGHLGSAIALGVARAGGSVLIGGRNRAALERCVAKHQTNPGAAGSISCQTVDLRIDSEIESFLLRLGEMGPRIDGWVNAAVDVSEKPGPIQSRQTMVATVESVLVNTMVATQAVATRMCDGGGGSIVNIASMYSRVSPDPSTYSDAPGQHNPPTYGAAKAGIVQFTRYAACHLAPSGVRVNSLSPGPFPNDDARSIPEFAAALSRRVPMGRTGRAEELIGPTVFLLSDASSYVTGHDLIVDGGWTSW